MRFLLVIFRWMSSSFWILAFLAMLVFNVLTLTVNGIATATSAAIAAVTGVQTVYGAMRQTVAERDTSLRATRQQVVNMTQELNTARISAETLEADLTHARQETDVVTQERTAARGRVKALETDLERASQKIATAERESIGLLTRVSTLEGDLVEARKPAMVTLRNQRVALREGVKTTTQRISSRTRKVAAANVTAMAGEGIPVWGIALIVASVTYDLKSACDTMNDMEEMRIALDPASAPDPDAVEVCAMRVPTAEEVWDMILASPGSVWGAAKDVLGEVVDHIPSWGDVKSAPGNLWQAVKDFVFEVSLW